MVDDRSYLFDMRAAAQKIKEFTNGMSKDQFFASELHQNAVVRLIQVIGEAARLVSTEFKDAHPEIEWRQITGMRHTLVHRYFNIDLEIVWEVVTESLNELDEQLRPILESLEDHEE